MKVLNIESCSLVGNFFLYKTIQGYVLYMTTRFGQEEKTQN